MRKVLVHCHFKEVLSFCLSFAEPESRMLSVSPLIWETYLLSVLSKHHARSEASSVNDERRGHGWETWVTESDEVCYLNWYFRFMRITHFNLIPLLKNNWHLGMGLEHLLACTSLSLALILERSHTHTHTIHFIMINK